MSNDLIRRRISAVASNAVAAAMDVKANRVLMTDHDAETRDAIYALLMAIQDTEQAIPEGAIPLVAPTQGRPDASLERVLHALQAAE